MLYSFSSRVGLSAGPRLDKHVGFSDSFSANLSTRPRYLEVKEETATKRGVVGAPAFSNSFLDHDWLRR
jgi:hypothetical protein